METSFAQENAGVSEGIGDSMFAHGGDAAMLIAFSLDMPAPCCAAIIPRGGPAREVPEDWAERVGCQACVGMLLSRVRS